MADCVEKKESTLSLMELNENNRQGSRIRNP